MVCEQGRRDDWAMIRRRLRRCCLSSPLPSPQPTPEPEYRELSEAQLSGAKGSGDVHVLAKVCTEGDADACMGAGEGRVS